MIICAALLNILFAQTPEWVYQYAHPSNTDEWPSAITIDDNGNSYTTGVICSDDTTGGHLTGIGVIKVNPYGQEQWIYFNDTLGRLNYGYDIAYKNKLFLTGYAEYFYPVHKVNQIVLCLDTTLMTSWLCRDTINPGRNLAITLDSNGSVYTAGICFSLATDIRVVKNDTLGNICWRYIYDGPTLSYDEPADIVADRWNNVYVGGYSTGETTYSDYTIIKLDSAGNEKWVYRYSGPNRDEIAALAVDAFGNVYAGGSSGEEGWDFFVVSVDSGGHERWIYRLDGLAPASYDFCHDIAVDDSGYCYAGGIIIDDSVGLFTVVKLDSSGQERWRFTDRGPWACGGGVSDLALDHHGNIYASGGFKGVNGRSHISMMKLTATGDSLGRYVYPHEPVSPYHDYTYDIVADEAGNGYLCGGVRVSQWDQDIVVMKFAGEVGINETQVGAPVYDPRLPAVCRNGLRVSGRTAARLNVYDVTGQIVIRPGCRGGYIPLAAGVYFAFLNEGGTTLKHKIVVVK